jgi:cell division protein FtsI (penicillin-binding protein 3)
VPDVKGMGAKDAVYLMEKSGLKVILNGTGKVHSQSIPAGNRITKEQTVRLTLK